MNWLNSKLINKSEVARIMAISPTLFRMKLKNVNRNRFTKDELERLEKIKAETRGLLE